MVVPNNHGFSYKNDHFGGVLGVPPFKETPIYTSKRAELWLFFGSMLESELYTLDSIPEHTKHA